MKMDEAIYEYINQGWYLLPLKPGEKAPLEGKGAKHASNNFNHMMGYLHRYPTMNLGIALGVSGMFAFDVDKRSGGLETLANLGPERMMPRTTTARTAQGGFHFFFQMPNVPMKNAKGKLPGIDIKTGVAYVVAAPSALIKNDKHEAGEYAWYDSDVAPAQAPVWLLKLLEVTETKKEHFAKYMAEVDKQLGTGNKGGSPTAALDAMCRELASLPEHSRRNNYLHWAACCCFEDGKLPQNEFTRALTNAAMAAGLTSQEIEATINSARKGMTEST